MQQGYKKHLGHHLTAKTRIFVRRTAPQNWGGGARLPLAPQLGVGAQPDSKNQLPVSTVHQFPYFPIEKNVNSFVMMGNVWNSHIPHQYEENCLCATGIGVAGFAGPRNPTMCNVQL